jgi:uncharacterized membrane protein YsdA (DUF1294 family)
MDKMKIKKQHRIILWFVAIIGLFGINGVFLYSIIFRPELGKEAFENLYAMVFIFEAFILLPLLCFLIAIAKLKSPNWLGFLVLSLLGSMAFSIPISVLLWTRGKEETI